jgi:hypothetical protein
MKAFYPFCLMQLRRIRPADRPARPGPDCCDFCSAPLVLLLLDGFGATLSSLLGLLCLLVLQGLYLGLQHLDLGLQQLRLLLLGFGISVAVGNFFEFVGGILDLPLQLLDTRCRAGPEEAEPAELEEMALIVMTISSAQNRRPKGRHHQFTQALQSFGRPGRFG